jgi:DNA processing protein
MVLVSPNGLDLDYFKVKNLENNLLISEFPPKTNITKDRIMSRNRIMGCIAEQLVLINSEKNGKLMHLVSAFLNLGKEVYCYPGDGENNDGNSDLIKQGANLITSIKDIN